MGHIAESFRKKKYSLLLRITFCFVCVCRKLLAAVVVAVAAAAAAAGGCGRRGDVYRHLLFYSRVIFPENVTQIEHNSHFKQCI
jgi:hypothetical protein